jgi:hypothetical protein
MMVPMKEHYISENKTSLFGGNQPTICTYTNVAHIEKLKKNISTSHSHKYIQIIHMSNT